MFLVPAAGARAGAEDGDLAKAVAASGIRAGLCVHVGCGSGVRTLELAGNEALVVHGLDGDAREVTAAREAIAKAKLGGRVSVECWKGPDLPYPDNYANLIVAEPRLPVPDAELIRVLAPGGLALVRQADARDGQPAWRKLTKSRPAGMGDWTHVKHGPDGNPVASDSIDLRGVPDRLRFICDVLESWTHFVRSSNGRLFIYHKGRFHARDAYNGVLLWTKTDYQGWPGRIVAVGDRLYIHQYDRYAAIDGATGQTTFTTELVPQYLSFIVADGAILSRQKEDVLAFDAETGKTLWTFAAGEHPVKITPAGKGQYVKSPAEGVQQLYAAEGRVYFSTVREEKKERTDAKGKKTEETAWRTVLLGVDVKTGKEVWRCDDERLPSPMYLTLWADGVLIGVGKSSYVGVSTGGKGELWALRVRERKGAALGDADMSGARGATRSCLHADGLLWLREALSTVYGETEPDEKDREILGWVGLDIRSGRIVRRIGYPVRRDWAGISPKTGRYEPKLDMPLDRNWSGRCYDDIATPNCMLAQTMEIVSLDGKDCKHIRGARGQCGIGYVIANNTVYGPPNQCIGCYPMIRGAVAYEVPSPKRLKVDDADRLEKGPAYGEPEQSISPPVNTRGAPPRVSTRGGMNNDEWPMYRHDTLRTSCTPAALEAKGLAPKWETPVGGRLTQPVVAGGRVFAAAVGEGRVVSLDAAGGKVLWQFPAGARIDTAPTIDGDVCIFGCHDGYVYCLRAADGALVWRFNAAPEHRRIISGEQVESPWPVFGAVLVSEGVAYATAGHYSAIEGGLHFWGLEARTGKVRFHQVFTGIKGDKAVILPTHWYKHEDHALNNVLLADKGRIRLYDEWGGWEFSPADGYMLAQIGAVPQPGWPQGRISAGEMKVEDRWVWAGWDRVTVTYLLRGEPITFEQTLEMDPRTRFSGLRTQYMFFPEAGATGIFMKTRGHTTRVDPEPWLVPTDPKIYGWPNGIFKDPNRNALRAKLWAGRELPIKASAVTITGKETLWVAGATAPPTTTPSQPVAQAGPPARLFAVSMKTGDELASWPLPAAPSFEGIAAARGCIYVATADGRVICMGR